MSILVTGTLEPMGLFGVVNDSNIYGAYQVVGTLSDRDNLSESVRKLGMMVYVRETSTIYTLNPQSGDPLDNTGWIEFTLGEVLLQYTSNFLTKFTSEIQPAQFFFTYFRPAKFDQLQIQTLTGFQLKNFLDFERSSSLISGFNFGFRFKPSIYSSTYISVITQLLFSRTQNIDTGFLFLYKTLHDVITDIADTNNIPVDVVLEFLEKTFLGSGTIVTQPTVSQSSQIKEKSSFLSPLVKNDYFDEKSFLGSGLILDVYMDIYDSNDDIQETSNFLTPSIQLTYDSKQFLGSGSFIKSQSELEFCQSKTESTNFITDCVSSLDFNALDTMKSGYLVTLSDNVLAIESSTNYEYILQETQETLTIDDAHSDGWV